MDLNQSLIFQTLIIFTILQRLYELKLSKKNEKKAIEQGGHIVPEKNYIFMVLFHTLWFLILLYFAFFTPFKFNPIFFYGGIFFFLIGQVIRIVVMKTLKGWWSTRVLVIPNLPVVKKGIFNYIRHPNYFGVVIEIAALPLVDSLYLVALVFSILNLFILYFRIRLEEKSLSTFTNYADAYRLRKD